MILKINTKHPCRKIILEQIAYYWLFTKKVIYCKRPVIEIKIDRNGCKLFT